MQRLFLDFVRRPLNNNFRLASLPRQGRLSDASLRTLIRQNAILGSHERLELYARQYWFRLLDSLIEDFPGVRAILGERKFDRLIEDYLARHPSESYTLRDLGKRFPAYLAKHRDFKSGRGAAAVEMARLEWIKIETFDSAEAPALKTERIASPRGMSLRIGLQPHVRLLHLAWPVDDWLLRLKREEWRAEASNAVDASGLRRRKSASGTPVFRKKTTHVVVHRHDFRVYFKRVEPEAFALLVALQKGATLHKALKSLPMKQGRGRHSTDWWQEKLRNWFSEWSALGWLTEL